MTDSDLPWGSFPERLALEMAAGKARLEYHAANAAQARALGNPSADPQVMSQIEAMHAKEEARRQEVLREDEIAKQLKMGSPGVVMDGGAGGWPMPTMVNQEAAHEAYERAAAEQQAVGPGVHKQDAVLVPPPTPKPKLKVKAQAVDLVDKLLDEK